MEENLEHEFKVGDIVRFKANSENSGFFTKGITGLEIKSVCNSVYRIYDLSNSLTWDVEFDKSELDTNHKLSVDEFEKQHHLGKYNIGSFMWAVEQMKQGKKVRRSGWDKDAKYYKKVTMYSEESVKGKCATWKEYEAYFDIDDFEATNWEIYEENKFGQYDVLCNGHIVDRKWCNGHNDDGITIFNPDSSNFNDLEKAMLRARELL